MEQAKKKHRPIQLLLLDNFYMNKEFGTLKEYLSNEPENQVLREKYIKVLEYIDSFGEPTKKAFLEGEFHPHGSSDKNIILKVIDDLVKIGDFIKHDA